VAGIVVGVTAGVIFLIVIGAMVWRCTRNTEEAEAKSEGNKIFDTEQDPQYSSGPEIIPKINTNRAMVPDDLKVNGPNDKIVDNNNIDLIFTSDRKNKARADPVPVITSVGIVGCSS
jgi:hypothetical protein